MKVREVARLGPFTDHHGGACSPDVADYRAVGDTEDETRRDFQDADYVEWPPDRPQSPV
jgi:hypothetical protein